MTNKAFDNLVMALRNKDLLTDANINTLGMIESESDMMTQAKTMINANWNNWRAKNNGSDIYTLLDGNMGMRPGRGCGFNNDLCTVVKGHLKKNSMKRRIE